MIDESGFRYAYVEHQANDREQYLTGLFDSGDFSAGMLGRFLGKAKPKGSNKFAMATDAARHVLAGGDLKPLLLEACKHPRRWFAFRRCSKSPTVPNDEQWGRSASFAKPTAKTWGQVAKWFGPWRVGDTSYAILAGRAEHWVKDSASDTSLPVRWHAYAEIRPDNIVALDLPHFG